MDTEKEIAGTIILITEAEGFLMRKLISLSLTIDSYLTLENIFLKMIQI